MIGHVFFWFWKAGPERAYLPPNLPLCDTSCPIVLLLFALLISFSCCCRCLSLCAVVLLGHVSVLVRVIRHIFCAVFHISGMLLCGQVVIVLLLMLLLLFALCLCTSVSWLCFLLLLLLSLLVFMFAFLLSLLGSVFGVGADARAFSDLLLILVLFWL